MLIKLDGQNVPSKLIIVIRNFVGVVVSEHKTNNYTYKYIDSIYSINVGYIVARIECIVTQHR